MIHKDIRYRRKMRAKAISRKVRTGKMSGWFSTGTISPVARGKCAKGKIFCSCPLCSASVSRCMGVHYKTVKNYGVSDRRKFLSLEESLKEFNLTGTIVEEDSAA